MNISLLADVMNEPSDRYALLYGLADPTFNKEGGFSRLLGRREANGFGLIFTSKILSLLKTPKG